MWAFIVLSSFLDNSYSLDSGLHSLYVASAGIIGCRPLPMKVPSKVPGLVMT